MKKLATRVRKEIGEQDNSIILIIIPPQCDKCANDKTIKTKIFHVWNHLDVVVGENQKHLNCGIQTKNLTSNILAETNSFVFANSFFIGHI